MSGAYNAELRARHEHDPGGGVQLRLEDLDQPSVVWMQLEYAPARPAGASSAGPVNSTISNVASTPLSYSVGQRRHRVDDETACAHRLGAVLAPQGFDR